MDCKQWNTPGQADSNAARRDSRAQYPRKSLDSSCRRRLAAYVECKQWSMPGQADSNAALQSYVRCMDGAYHMKDAYGYNWPHTVVPLAVRMYLVFEANKACCQ